MKNTFCRVFVTVAVMTAAACTDPFGDAPKQPYTGTPTQPTEFHTWVTVWNGDADQGFTGFVGQTPHTDLSKAKFYWVQYGQKISIETIPDATKIPAYMEMYETYFWVTVKNDVVMVYYKSGASAQPPTPLEIVMEY